MHYFYLQPERTKSRNLPDARDPALAKEGRHVPDKRQRKKLALEIIERDDFERDGRAGRGVQLPPARKDEAQSSARGLLQQNFSSDASWLSETCYP